MSSRRPSANDRIAEALEVLAENVRRKQLAHDRPSPVARIGSRSEPRRLSVLTFARAIPGYMELWAKIPAEFWALDSDTATVACPCGRAPELEIGRPKFCEDGEEPPGEGQCPRAYVFDGETVRVAFSPKGEITAQSSDASVA